MKKLSIFVLVIVLSFTSMVFGIELRTAAQDSFPKYFLNEVNGKKVMDGLCYDIVELLEKKIGIKFTGKETFLPFNRIEASIENGDLDVFVGFNKTPDREKKYVYVDIPLYSVKEVLAYRINEIFDIKSFDDVKKLGSNGVIMTLQGTSIADYLKSIPGLIIDDGASNIEDNLNKLILKRGRFVYYHDLGLISTIKKMNVEKSVKLLPTVFREYSQYLAFSKKVDKEIVAKVEKAIKDSIKSGEMDKILKKYLEIK